LSQITCPTLVIQADPSRGGVLSDDDVAHVLSLLADGLAAPLSGVGHDLGLDTWEVAPLLRALTEFLEMV
jgi:hypothetical protein